MKLRSTKNIKPKTHRNTKRRSVSISSRSSDSKTGSTYYSHSNPATCLPSPLPSPSTSPRPVAVYLSLPGLLFFASSMCHLLREPSCTTHHYCLLQGATPRYPLQNSNADVLVDPPVAQNTGRWSTRHSCQLFDIRPDPGFSPTDIVVVLPTGLRLEYHPSG